MVSIVYDGEYIFIMQGTFNLLTELYSLQGNLAGATNMLECMKALDIPILEEVYANLITAHARAGDIVSAEGVLEVMREAGHVPGVYSYTALFCAFAEKGDMAGIERVSVWTTNLFHRYMCVTQLSLKTGCFT